MEPHSEQWEAILFGPLRVRCGERGIERFPPGQAVRLFAFLVAYPRRHSREELIDLFWPDGDIEACRHRLSQAIWRIRQTIHSANPESSRDVLVADRTTVGIEPDTLTSDVARFQSLLGQAASMPAGAPQQIEALEQANTLYGDAGGFLPDFYDDWAIALRQKLQADAVLILERLVRHCEQTNRMERALTLAARAVAIDPLVEASHQTLIRLLAASGQYAAAQRQYRDLTRLLARELNAEPSAATRTLMQQIHQEAIVKEVSTGLATPLPTPPVGAQMATTLPVPLTSFYGREAILKQLDSFLQNKNSAPRLITLLGTGGIGKTRLAVEFARSVAARADFFATAFVSLADIREPRLIIETISDAVSSSREGTPITRIVHALAAPAGDVPAPFLLVLDNAEILAGAVGPVVAELLARIPRLRILVTSQRPLGVGGEQELRLGPLELPPTHETPLSGAERASVALENVPSVQLFLDRARSVRPDLSTDSGTIAEIARICRRLEGLPLAIELCAGWAQTLSVAQMWEMLSQRFELLVSRRSDIPERHRTLRAAIEYSYLQLPGDLQRFFVHLSVFRDGWTLAAAAHVCHGGSLPAALTALAQMQEYSLIVAAEARAGDSMRYRMLESLRDFAVEQRTMAQSVEHRQAHAVYFSRFVQEATARISGNEHALWEARMADDLENIRAMLEYLNERGTLDELWEATVVVTASWNTHHNVNEARFWLERALAKDDPARNDTSYHHLKARLLYAYSDSLRILSEYTEATASAERALAIWQSLEDSRGITRSLVALGITAMLSNDYDRAQAMLTEALTRARTLKDDLMIASILNSLAGVAIAQQDWQTAWETLREGLYLYRKSSSIPNIAFCLSNLGLVARYQGDYSSAETLLREAIHVSGQSKFRVAGLLNLATVERLRHNFKEALSLLGDVIREIALYSERRTLAWCLKEMGHLAIALRLWSQGLQLLACAESLRETLGISFKPLGPADIDRDRTQAWEALGEIEAETNWALGRAAVPESLLIETKNLLEFQLDSGGIFQNDAGLMEK